MFDYQKKNLKNVEQKRCLATEKLFFKSPVAFQIQFR